MRSGHSDFEVVRNDAYAPEVVPNDALAPEVFNTYEQKENADKQYPRGDFWTHGDKRAAAYNEPESYGSEAPKRSTRRFRGREWSRRAIISLSILGLLVVIAAAVGGGVGGSLASRHTQSGQASTVPTGPSSSPSPNAPASASATSTSSTITTSTVTNPTASATVLRDCPSSNNSVYTIQQGDSRPLYFRKVCGQSFQPSGQGGVHESVNQPTKSLDDCINLCAAYNTQNQTQISAGQGFPCNAVCWRNAGPGDGFPYQCFGNYSVNSSTSGFPIRQEAICDSAAWMNQGV